MSRHKIVSKWKVLNESDEKFYESPRGTIKVSYDDNSIVSLKNWLDEPLKNEKELSPCLALYRILNLFECGLSQKCVDFYKSVWTVVLEHVSTKTILHLGDYKGYFEISTPYTTLESIDLEYKNDLKELLNLIASPGMKPCRLK
jgi:hypothetical protein